MEYCQKEGDIRELSAKIDNMEKRQDKMETLIESIHNLTVEMSYVKDDLSSINKTLGVLKDRPSVFWEKLFWIVASSIVGLVVGVYFKGV